MLYTNKFNLPQSLFDAIAKSTYDVVPDCNIIPVTQLINPPLIRQLTLRHQQEIIEDISENIWRLLGSAIHSVMERAEQPHRLIEERIKCDFNEISITGKIDLYEAAGDAETGLLQDYKVTSAWSIVYKDVDDKQYENQLNAYAYLYIKNGFKVSQLRFIALLRDWSKSKAQQDKTYPQLPIAVIPIKLWSVEEQEKYIKQRIAEHITANTQNDNEIQVCTPQERWTKPTTYAIYKGRNKRATKVVESAEIAKAFCNGNSEYRVETRQGVDVRCMDYCSVAPFCKYWKDNYANRVSEESVETEQKGDGNG